MQVSIASVQWLPEQQTSSGEEVEVGAKTEENVRKQLTEFFFQKISIDLRKCQLREKLVRAPQGNQS